MSEHAADTPHARIADDEELWRRLPPQHWMLDEKMMPPMRRISSAAFDDPEMSVVVARACAGGEATLLAGHDGFGIARFTARDVRDLGGEVVWAPDDALPGHAHVTGFGERRDRKKRKALGERCRIDPEPALE